MTVLLNVVLPVFIVAGVAALAHLRLRFEARTLSRIVFYLFGPALVFDSLASSEIGGAAYGQLAAAVLLTILALWVLGSIAARLLRLEGPTQAAFLVAVLLMNGGNFGLSVNYFAFGDVGLAWASLYFTISALLSSSLGAYLSARGRTSARQALRRVAGVPYVYAAALGLLFNLGGVTMPEPLTKAIHLLAQASVPVMLAVLGVRLAEALRARQRVQHLPALGVAALMRLIVSPALAFLFANLVGLSGIARDVTVLESAMPTAVITTILATEFDSDPPFAALCVLVTTLVSLPTLTVLLNVLMKSVGLWPAHWKDSRMSPDVLLNILALAGLLLLALIARWALGHVPPAQVSGRLTFDPARLPAGSLTAGPFVITWDPAWGGQLSIHHSAQPDKLLWSTLPGAGFVATAYGVDQVTGARGFFFVKDKQQVLLADQSIDAIAAEGSGRSVTLSGALSRKGGQQAVRYTLTFAAAGQTPSAEAAAPLTAGPGDALDFRLEVHDDRFNRTFLTYASEPDERIFGFGMQFTYFDLKGKRVPIFVTEQGVGRGAQPITLGANLTAKAGGSWHTTYAPVPHYITSKQRSLFLKSYEYAIFDLRRDNNIQIQLWSPRLSGRILTGDTPAALIESYTASAGRMRELPDWILEGAVVGMQGGTDKVRGVLAQLRELDTPVAAVWLEDWVGQRLTSFGKQLWWNWELDEEHYPGWDALLAELDGQGIRVMTYVNCHLADVSAKPGHRRNLFQEAAAQGYLVRDQAGEPYLIQNSDFYGGMIDLTNPAARDWIKGVINEQVIGAGASGWMADYGEALPYDAVLHSGEPASSYHNRYPEEWGRLNREVIEEAGTDQMVFFSRSGYRQSPSHTTLFWLGDQLVSWDRFDGIKTAVTGLLSSGLSGFSLNHSDIGGHTAVNSPIKNYHRSKELLLRWMELNAFTAIFRTHEGNRPDENHQFFSDAETLAHFSRFATIYAAWAFYRKELVREASASGLPVVRHPFIHYPDDANVYRLSYQQFMVGSEFMVAPVLDPGADTVSVYLPAGRWVHTWSGETYTTADSGLTVTVAAPLGQPGVFYREGSRVAAQFVANLQDAGVLEPVTEVRS